MIQLEKNWNEGVVLIGVLVADAETKKKSKERKSKASVWQYCESWGEYCNG